MTLDLSSRSRFVVIVAENRRLADALGGAYVLVVVS
jgi:hypothetical protein